MKKKICFFLLSLFALPLYIMAETPIKDLDAVIVERRHCDPLPNLLNGILGLQFEQIVFEYNSVGPDLKTPVRLTASLSMPTKVYNKEKLARAMIIYNEFTTAKHRERTSQDELADIAFFLNGLQNFIVLAPDLYGWTLTEDKPQAYCCPEITARETLDAWDAAMTILDQEEYRHDNIPIFNVGYSSGGFSAMAVQKYIDEKRHDIDIKLTSAGGAPFDITTVYENYVKTNFTGYKCALPLMMVAYKETFNLPYSYSDIFLPPLSDNIQEWILSKDYGTWDINELIGLDKGVNEILSPTACDYTQGIGREMYLKFRDNSLCGPFAKWQPSTDTKYFIFHSAGDLYMHYHVGMEMANYLKDHGCDVKTDFLDWGNHIDYGIYSWLVQTLVYMEANIADNQSEDISDSINDLMEVLTELDDIITAYDDDSTEGSQNEETGNITSVQAVKNMSLNDADGYYSISGKKLNGKPERGVYIHQGVKKVAW